MAAVDDVKLIEQELKALREKSARARERLDAMRPGRGRGGRGPASMGGRGGRDSSWHAANGAGPRDAAPRDQRAGGRMAVFDRLAGSGGGSRHSRDEPAPAAGASGRQPIQSRLSSRVVVPPGSDAPQADGLARSSSDAAGAPGGGRKRLLSAVVVEGVVRTRSTAADGDADGAAAGSDAGDAAAPGGGAGPAPLARRPSLQLDDHTKKRARRMLGALLVGTLQKAKDEDVAFRASTTAARRQQLEQHAVERSEAMTARAREEAAAARRQERAAGICELLDINLQADTKLLELGFAKRIARKQQLLAFCVTATQPPLHWRPAKPSEASQAGLDAHAASFEAWKAEQLQQLEAEKAQLAEAAAAKRAAAEARAAGSGGGGGDAANGHGDGMQEDGGEEAGAEDEEQQQQQDGEEQQQDEDEQQQQQEEEEEEAPRPSRRRQRGSDDDDVERLLSSEDEDA